MTFALIMAPIESTIGSGLGPKFLPFDTSARTWSFY